MENKNIKASLLAAVLVGIFSYPTLLNLDFVSSYGKPAAIGVSLVLSLLTILGLLFTKLLSRWWGTFWQLGKFIVAGGLNTFLDFAVLNLLISLTAIASGWWFSLFKALSFSAAVLNSYFWNKYWTFEAQSKKKTEFMEFLLVSVVGLGINVGAASLVVLIDPLWGLSPVTWANAGAFVAVIAAMAWNFLGYKFLVFRKKRTS